jgi:capsular exopolysaccharide synthesis family protein
MIHHKPPIINNVNIKEKNLVNTFDIKYLFSVFNSSWLFVALCIISGVGIAYLYNKIKPPVYEVRASVLIKPDNAQATQAASQIFQSMGILTEENNFQNKIQVLKSSPLIREAIKNLDFQVSYFVRSPLSSRELYKTSPFIVVLNQNHPQPIGVIFNIEITDESSFEISAKGEDINIYNFSSQNVIQTVNSFKMKSNGVFGTDIQSDDYDFKLLLNENYKSGGFSSQKYSFIIYDNSSLVKIYQGNLKVEPVDIQTSVANIRMKSAAPDKAIDFMTSLTNAYLAMDVEEKIHASIKTIEYIDNQLGAITDSLRQAENNLQRFRTSNQVMDISVKSGKIYDELQELQREKANTLVKYKYYQYINDYFEQSKELSDIIAPSAMGIEDPLLNNLIGELTKLNTERSGLIENNQGKSPYLKQLNIKIDNLKNTIGENIKYILNTTEIAVQDLDTRLNGLNVEINKLPTTERRLLGYERNFNLNDAIYTFLLQRRAEAQIAKASYMPGATVIEPPDISGSGPVEPKKNFIYMIGLLLGLIMPVLVIRLKDILQNRITQNTDLAEMTDLPVLGKIYKNNKKIDLVVQSFPKSHMAESFRMVRSGLNYFLQNSESSVLVITSSFGQEGKSFIANNLAASLALTSKKIVLLGFDLRRPRVYEKLDINNEIGLSSFLSNQATLEDVIQHSNIPNFDVITSGPIPPNPAELTASSRTTELFRILREKYDFIIVDTPPVGIVSDTFMLMDKADLNIYVVRQNSTPRIEFQTIINDLKKKNFRNLCLIVNDIPLVKKSKYGYEYYEK